MRQFMLGGAGSAAGGGVARRERGLPRIERQMSDLEGLLARESGVGTYDSTGTFTLSLSEARRKLQQFQLKSLEQAVLKLIQGVVQLEPQAIWIESHDHEFVIYWAEAEQSVSPEHIVGDLERTMLGAGSPQKDLSMALLGFLDKEPEEVWWVEWQGGDVQSTVSLFGTETQVQLRRPPSMYQRSSALAIRAGKQKLSLDREQIAARTIFCPALLLWNGRLICELSWNPPGHFGGRVYWADFYFPRQGPLSRGIALKPIGPCQKVMTEVQTLSGGEFCVKPNSYSVLRRYVMGEKGRFLHLLGRKPQTSMFYGLVSEDAPQQLSTALGRAIWVVGADDKAPAALLCVKHGVMLDPCPLSLGMGGTVAVLATPDLEVDLSQFKPIMNSPSWDAVVQQVRDTALMVVGEVAENPITRSSDWGGNNIPLSWGLASAAGGVAGSIGGFVLTFHLLGGLGFIAGGVAGCVAGYRMMKKLSDRVCDRRLQNLTRAVTRDV